MLSVVCKKPVQTQLLIIPAPAAQSKREISDFYRELIVEVYYVYCLT